MIAGDVGEAAGRDAQAVEPELIEAVRRRFDGKMGDAVAGERIDRTVQLDRIRRGQRAVGLAARRDDADRADAGRAETQRAPDLPREGRDRRFAAGAGDGGDGFGLARIKFRRGQRQRAPRVGNAHECHVERQRAERRSATIAAAPAAIAGATKRAPSALLPAMATKRSPRLTARLSAVTPPTSRAAWRAVECPHQEAKYREASS